MTLNASDVRDEYTASASQTIFNYTFKIYASTDLDVYVTPSGQACTSADLTTAYAVSGVGLEDGGTITLTTPTSSGDLVTIVSSIPTSRTTDYQNNGDFRAATVNDDFDRTVSLVKQAVEKTNRSLLFDDCQQGVTSLSLPSPTDGNFLRWKSDLSGLENVTLSSSGIAAEVSVTNYVALRALNSSSYTDGQVIFVTNDGIAGRFVVKTGTVTDNGGTLIVFTDDSNRYAERSGTETANIKWFGAVGDGVTDDTTAFQAAIDAFLTLFVPVGTFLVSGLTFPSNQKILGTGEESIIKSSNTSGGICMQTNAISMGALDYLSFSDLRIQGVGSGAGGGAGLWLNDGTRWSLSNVIIDQHGGDGLIIQDWSWIGQANNCKFVNNGSDGVETLMPETGGAAFAIDFISCTASGNSGNGYNINTTPVTDGNVINIIGGTIEQNTIGIKAQRTRALNIDGVYFEGNSSKSVEVTGQAALGYVMMRNIGGAALENIDIESGPVIIDGIVFFEEGEVITLRTTDNYDVKNFILQTPTTTDPCYIRENENCRNSGITGVGNQLRNGNFIVWGNEQTLPSYFSVAATATYARATPPTRCSGDAVQITAGSANAGLKQTISNMIEGQIVTVSAWVKVDSGDSGILEIQDDGTSAQSREFTFTTTSWKRYTIQHKVSAGSSQVEVQFVAVANTDVIYVAEIQATLQSDLRGFLYNDLDFKENNPSNEIQRLETGATPDVEGIRLCRTRDGTTVTDFTNGVEGQEITILFEHTKTITDGTNIFLAGSANFAGASSDTLSLIQKADGNWYERSRSVN